MAESEYALNNDEALCMKPPEFLRELVRGNFVDTEKTGPPSVADVSSFPGNEPFNSLFMFDDSSKIVQLYQPSQKKLTKIYSYCDGMKGDFTACMLGEYLYIFFEYKKSFRLNMRTENSTWNQLDDMLHDLGHNIQCAAHGNDIYVTRNDKIERYRTDEVKWENVDLNGNECYDTALVSYKGHLFCIGGWRDRRAINDVMKFTSSSSKWTSAKSMNFRRSCASAVVFDGKIYVAGGFDTRYQDMREFEMYDDASNLWTILPQMISPRYGFRLCVVDNQIFAVGNDCDDIGIEMEVFDATNNKWLRNQFNQKFKIRPLATVSAYIPIK